MTKEQASDLRSANESVTQRELAVQSAKWELDAAIQRRDRLMYVLENPAQKRAHRRVKPLLAPDHTEATNGAVAPLGED